MGALACFLFQYYLVIERPYDNAVALHFLCTGYINYKNPFHRKSNNTCVLKNHKIDLVNTLNILRVAECLDRDVESVVSAFQRCTPRQKEKLYNHYWRPETSTWGTVANRLFGVNAKPLRWHLFLLWTENRKNIQGLVTNQVINLEEQKDVGNECFCYCQKKYRKGIDPRFIQCDKCETWYHQICVGVDETHDFDSDYNCPFCNSSDVRPHIFEETDAENESSESTVSHLSASEDEHESEQQDSDGEFEILEPKNSENSYSLSFEEEDDFDIHVTQVSDVEDSSTDEDIKPQTTKCKNKSSSESEGAASSDGLDKCTVQDDNNRTQGKLKPDNEGNENSEEDVSDVEGLHDSSQIPMAFSFDIDHGDWEKVWIRQKTSATVKKGSKVISKISNFLKPEYTDLLSKMFQTKNPQCVLTFNKKRVNTDEAKISPFLAAYAHCKRDKCDAHYSFKIERIPKDEDKITVNVRLTSGTICHLVKEKDKARWCKGPLRKEFQKELIHKKASVKLRELSTKSNVDSTMKGHITDTFSLKVLQKVRDEGLQLGDLSKDPLMDLIFTYLDHKEKVRGQLKGYAQKISVIPLQIHSYTYAQMLALKLLLDVKSEIVLIGDATGTCVTPLPAPLDTSDPLVYTFIVKHPKEGKVPLPIAELVSTEQTHSTIAYFLHSYFQQFKALFNVTQRFFGIARLEIDFSKALVAASVQAFNNMDVVSYMTKLWDIIVCQTAASTTLLPIHICRFHSLRFLREYIKKCYGGQNTEVGLWHSWCHAFIHSKDMHSFHRRVVDAFTLSGMSYMTDEVQRIVGDLADATTRLGDGQWMAFTNEDPGTKHNFWNRSPFGRYAWTIGKQIEDLDKKLVSTGGRTLKKDEQVPNLMKNEAFFKYLKVHVFPYWPILSHAVMQAFGQTINDDTTNAVENYHKLLKIDHKPYTKKLTPARWVRWQKDWIVGGAHLFVRDLPDSCKQKFAEEMKKYEGLSDCAADNVKKNVSPGDPHTKGNKTLPTGKDDNGNSDEDTVSSSSNKKTDGDSIVATASERGSPEREVEVFKKNTRLQLSAPRPLGNIPFVSWGGTCRTNEGAVIKLSNTCSIDAGLQVLVSIANLHPAAKNWMINCAENNDSEDLLHKLLEGDINGAKKVWISELLGQRLDNNLDLFGTDDENFFQPIATWCKILRKIKCSNKSCEFYVPKGGSYNPAAVHETTILSVMAASVPAAISALNCEAEKPHCPKCFRRSAEKFDFGQETPEVFFLYINGMILGPGRQEVVAKESELIEHVKIADYEYALVAYTMYTGNHFYCVIMKDGRKYRGDGLTRGFKKHTPDKMHSVSSVWYVKIDRKR